MPRELDVVDALRPATLAEFSGQPDLARELGIVLSSAARRGANPDHMLFFGPPGTGKTTLALIIAAELRLPLVTASGPALAKPADVTNLLMNLHGPSVVFIDEIHAVQRLAEEHLYSAMEDGVLDITMGEGLKARSVRIPLKPFVLVGATTQPGKLTGPMRDRFGYKGRLRLYEVPELAAIVARSGKLIGLALDEDAAVVIAQRAKGTPRIANALTRRVRDFVWPHEATDGQAISVSGARAAEALDAFGIDNLGLDSMARDLLRALCVQFAGGPVGAETLAAGIGESVSTLAEVHEPFLMHAGLLARTQRGRVATPAAYVHLGLAVPEGLAARTA